MLSQPPRTLVAMTEPDTEAAASPYATGGGGTVLEHRYGAVLLAHLLAGDPLVELGADTTVVRVVFQAKPVSPVDDLLVVGRCGDGSDRKASVAVRRAPRLVPSDGPSVDLLATFVPVLNVQWTEVHTGRWRLALAAAATMSVRQLGVLAEIVATAPDDPTFRAAVARRWRTTRPVRNRLVALDGLMEKACRAAEVASLPDMTWRFLSSLMVRELRLEAPDHSDRTATAAMLRNVTVGGTAAEADRLLEALNTLADRYAPAAAVVDEAMLRRDLAGVAELRRGTRYPAAWSILDSLGERLRQQTGRDLHDPSRSLELDRAETRAELVTALAAVGGRDSAPTSALAVTGEPDVGKSALTLRAIDDLRASGEAVTAFSLRDLPATIVDTEHFLGGRLHEILGGSDVRAVRLLVVDGAEAALEGRQELLAAVATAALRAGLGVVAVTRTDGERVVRESLQNALAAASLPARDPQRRVVEGLTSPEVAQTVDAFPALAGLADQPRDIWLLARPGLVDLLLRAEATPTLAALRATRLACQAALRRRGEHRSRTRRPTAGDGRVGG